MIKKIKRIKNLGLVFSDYNWKSGLQEFKRYNILYGWNGSGKTTLTKLFSVLGVGSSEKHPDLEYEIETETGAYKQSQSFDKKIRVFNQDYVRHNIGILEGKANPIFILGEENKKSVEDIERLEKLLQSKKDRLRIAVEEKNQTATVKSKLFTDTARTISADLTP